jgi:hypothetical protein
MSPSPPSLYHCPLGRVDHLLPEGIDSLLLPSPPSPRAKIQDFDRTRAGLYTPLLEQVLAKISCISRCLLSPVPTLPPSLFSFSSPQSRKEFHESGLVPVGSFTSHSYVAHFSSTFACLSPCMCLRGCVFYSSFSFALHFRD